jgi:ubiquinone biosynthesis protein
MRKFPSIFVPRPVEDYTTTCVLTMEYVGGEKIVDLRPCMLLEDERKMLADELFRAYLHQVLVDGFFHADPHPGNLLLTPNHQIGLVDLGMVVRVTPRLREHLADLLVSIAEGRGEEAASLATKIGFPNRDFRKSDFQEQIAHLVADSYDASLDRIHLGEVVLELNAIAANNGIRLPDEVTMLSKTLLNLDKSLATLDPQLNLNRSIRDHAGELMRRSQKPTLSAGSLFHALSESKELVGLMPERLNRIMELIAENQLKIDVDAVDERKLIEGIQKVANRITAGLLLAALIIGASLMMDVDTDMTLFGYPAIAMVFFLLAATGAIFLIVQILFKDRRQR